jgi:hypothetical protein
MPPAAGTVMTPPARSNVAGNLFGGAFGDILQKIDIMAIIQALATKQPPEGLIESLIFNWFSKAMAKKPAQALDTSGKGMMFFSRGVGQTQSALRMKNVDPKSMAIAISTQADEMLKEKLIPADQLYWKGRKSGADSFLASLMFQPAAPAGSTGPAAGAIPPPPAPAPPGGRKRRNVIS